jgi:alcohol dehydrogenase class IV
MDAIPKFFEFATATRILFGAGTFEQVGVLAAQMGWRALVVISDDLGRAQPLLERLAAAEVIPTLYMIRGEPTVEVVQKGVELARMNQCDLVVGFGGGSALDTGKAIAALLTNPGELLSYLEVVGDGQPLTEAAAPYIAIPTTAGTGAEVTRNAVLGVPEKRVKVSLRSPLMLPRLALVDPELTFSLPPEITAYTGLDALTQLIEPYVSNQSNPLTDAICREGMAYAAVSLHRAWENGGDTAARQGMSLASLFGGLALANARLGAVHGFAGPLGGMFPAPHGAICARLLPFVFEANLRALRAREPENPVLDRFNVVARLLTGDAHAQAADGLVWLGSLCRTLQVAPLSAYGVDEPSFDPLIDKARRASSMKGNPIRLADDELREILVKAL